ncbi:MAG: bifunctional riboflavin kinase/FMN adenylyltransferase [Bacteroidales bacterium]|nr:bifunctional riboflavin kinase/FMN adenylyltransferase [Bacteroidales bacterium]
MVVACTGFFDGVHRGHRAVLGEVCRIASEKGCKSAVITFWPHPRAVLQQDAVRFRLLNSLEEKQKLMHSLGIDDVFVLPFDKDFAKQSTEEFFRKYLKVKYAVRTLVVGYDHRVGSDVNQTQDQMFEIARKLGINPIRVEQFGSSDIDDTHFKESYNFRADNLVVTKDKNNISSTKIRDCISNGNISQANYMLGYRYGLEGVVVEGQRIGRTIGFPTANIKLYEPLKLLPADGVYAVWVEAQGKTYRGITNIGTRPTVSFGSEKTIETHILDFDEDIYGLSLKIELTGRLRNEQKFPSLDELKIQLFKDRENSLEFLPDNGIKLR